MIKEQNSNYIPYILLNCVGDYLNFFIFSIKVFFAIRFVINLIW